MMSKINPFLKCIQCGGEVWTTGSIDIYECKKCGFQDLKEIRFVRVYDEK